MASYRTAGMAGIRQKLPIKMGVNPELNTLLSLSVTVTETNTF